jgi:hypothetical protein
MCFIEFVLNFWCYFSGQAYPGAAEGYTGGGGEEEAGGGSGGEKARGDSQREGRESKSGKSDRRQIASYLLQSLGIVYCV